MLLAPSEVPPGREGRLAIDKNGHEIHYIVFGEGDETLLCLHGGPGGNHKYLRPLARLASDGLRVVLYDQLGSGASDRPDDDSLWVVERFVQEVEAVRGCLGLGKVHLFGQSWGGQLALQYAVDHPAVLQSLILSNAGASTAEILHGMSQHRLGLDPATLATMIKHESLGDYEHADYDAAVRLLYSRHLRRSTPFEPEESLRELNELVMPQIAELSDVYRKMWGPNEFLCRETLLDWDVSDRIATIAVPTLIVCGLYDEVSLDCHRTLARFIPDNEFVIFGNSSHIVTQEKESEAYLGVIDHFVARARTGRRTAVA
jgi:proline iminopeptidase